MYCPQKKWKSFFTVDLHTRYLGPSNIIPHPIPASMGQGKGTLRTVSLTPHDPWDYLGHIGWRMRESTRHFTHGHMEECLTTKPYPFNVLSSLSRWTWSSKWIKSFGATLVSHLTRMMGMGGLATAAARFFSSRGVGTTFILTTCFVKSL